MNPEQISHAFVNSCEIVKPSLIRIDRSRAMDSEGYEEEDSKIGFLDKQKLNKKLLERGIPIECSDIIENGLYHYMREIISDIYAVHTDL
jgi:hypothetical protein